MRAHHSVCCLLLLSAAVLGAEESWRFITLADWHFAEKYTQLPQYQNGHAQAVRDDIATVAMLKKRFGGELIMLPGDSNKGHWVSKNFMKNLRVVLPADQRQGLTEARSVLVAGERCYAGMVSAFHKGGYDRLLMAVGDHELGDNPWRPGTAVSRLQPEYRQAFAKGFNLDRNGEHRYPQAIGEVPSRPLGTPFEDTSYAYRHRNVLFVTVDVFHQEDPNKQIGSEGSVTGVLQGEHLAWFDRVLAAGRKDPSVRYIFVQAHLPVLHPVRKVNSSGMLMDDEVDSTFWKTMRKHEVDIYFAGEVHADTVTRDPESDMLQIVSRGNRFHRLLTCDIGDEEIVITCHEHVGEKTQDGEYSEIGRLTIDTSGEEAVITAAGELVPLDRKARLIHIDFESEHALQDRPVVGMGQGRQLKIQGTVCTRSFANRGVFGQGYDAIFDRVALEDGPQGKGQAGVFTTDSRMAIKGMGPHHGGHVVSYALWMKTTAKTHMTLINSGAIWARNPVNCMNLNLDDGVPELMTAPNRRVLAQGVKLNDGRWHHIAISMPKKGCTLSELRFFIDGVAVETALKGPDGAIDNNQAVCLSFGGLGISNKAFEALPTTNFIGSMDDISVWCRPLADDEVAALAERR